MRLDIFKGNHRISNLVHHANKKRVPKVLVFYWHIERIRSRGRFAAKTPQCGVFSGRVAKAAFGSAAQSASSQRFERRIPPSHGGTAPVTPANPEGRFSGRVAKTAFGSEAQSASSQRFERRIPKSRAKQNLEGIMPPRFSFISEFPQYGMCGLLTAG